VVASGDRCPRAQCGGTLFPRDVVTEEGGVHEWHCTLCSRSFGARVDAPYPPARLRLTPAAEAFLARSLRVPVDSCRPGPQSGLDDTVDIDVRIVRRV
jgi:hypothetical protein